jgi:hypothetical protein
MSDNEKTVFKEGITTPSIPSVKNVSNPTAVSIGNGLDPVASPWQDSEVLGSFFPEILIDFERWNKLYPYRLLVVKQGSDGGYSIVSTEGKVGNTQGAYSNTSSGGYRLLWHEVGNKWEFHLPITPQQLQISTQFAINTSATQRGIVEEHGGVRFKNIMCSGTMGVWVNRPSKDPELASQSWVKTLFSSTLNAFDNFLGQANTLINSVTQNHPATKPKPAEMSQGAGDVFGTGYAHAMLLDQFLEQYAEAKKDPANASWRLVFDIPKQNQSFVVTPVQFTWNQSVESPNEIKYSFQLRAWKRINLDEPASESEFNELKLEKNVIQKFLTSVENARRVVGAYVNVVKAIRSDFQTSFNALRELSLLAKDLAGIPQTIIDLPRQIVSDFQSTIIEGFKQDGRDIQQKFRDTDKSWQAFLKIFSKQNQNEGLSLQQTSSGQVGNSASSQSKTDPSNEIFVSPEEYFDLFNSIDVLNLKLTPEQQQRIDDTQTDPTTITVDDLLKNRQQLLDLATQISNFFGAGDELYSKIYGKPKPYVRAQEMTIDEYQILNALYDVIQNIDNITATQEIDDGRIASAMEYVGGVATANEIPFEISQSKLKVPVPYGLTIEEIALRYLGDSDKWIEIVTLNSLKSPYIDENGFMRSLLSNATGRQLNVASVENLYLGQKITLLSNTQIPTTRRIINIERINDFNYLISLDGLDNLDSYTILDNARIKAYLPGTTNSQNQIFIPSDLTPSNTLNTREVSKLSQDSLVGLSKIDWLIQEDGDISLDIYGDVKLSAGFNNLIQALKLKFLTPTGRLLKHPEFGAGIKSGLNIADLNSTQLYDKIKEAILTDKRFSSIKSMELVLNGPTLTINLSVGYNKNEVLPLSFSVNL